MTTSERPYLLAQLHRTHLSLKDAGEAAEYLSKIHAAADNITKRALLTAAIVAYSRPFTKNDKPKSEYATQQLSASPEKIFSSSGAALHEKLLKLRNEVVAHTEYRRQPVNRIEGHRHSFTMAVSYCDVLDLEIDLALFKSMCHTVEAHCLKTSHKLNEEIHALDGYPVPSAFQVKKSSS